MYTVRQIATVAGAQVIGAAAVNNAQMGSGTRDCAVKIVDEVRGQTGHSKFRSGMESRFHYFSLGKINPSLDGIVILLERSFLS
ncbi:hypothetical protein PanWU01x14_159580 [Parasponia andersonii]|uniref:Uncharacterized protein n=1 Tax=Parasponia andersonii TaxID=3476 RepID=A0A2P5CEI5_PARAD|nr:hypothetical protein PanWU01x14_159580 [Parasponia andersonii]